MDFGIDGVTAFEAGGGGGTRQGLSCVAKNVFTRLVKINRAQKGEMVLLLLSSRR